MLTAFDNLLFERFRMSIRSQAIFRLMFAGYLLTTSVSFDNTYLSSIPDDSWHPTFGPALFMSPPNVATIQSIDLLFAAACFFLFVGFHTRLASSLVVLLSITTRLWAYSLGKVDHDILFVITPACLAFSRWGHDLSIDAWRRGKSWGRPDQDAWPFGLLAILISFGFSTSGIQKLIGGWLDPSTLATVGWMVYFGKGFESNAFASSYINDILLFPHFFLESLDWVTVLFDLGFLVAICKRRWFQTWCMMAVLFHFGTALLFKIYFSNYPPVYAAFFPWDRLLGYCVGQARFHRWLGIFTNPIGLLTAGGVVFFLQKLVTVPLLGAVFTVTACIGLTWVAWTTVEQRRRATTSLAGYIRFLSKT